VVSKRAPIILLLISIGVSFPAVTQWSGRAHFSRFVTTPLPQRAIGDLDGDGRPDVARIDRQVPGRDQISVTLSGSPDAVSLGASVESLIEDDVDHDGDLDLLATTGSGDVLIWVNDGHGQFTRRLQSPARTISGQPVFQSHDDRSLIAVATSVPALPARVYAWRAVIALAIRPPTGVNFVDGHTDRLPPLRAPPITVLS
jgi:hypothetical protein